jgi:RNA polymerase sigma factor (sigma-70 family)
MATSQLKQVIQTLRSATLPLDEVKLTDGQLLECYIRSREESAFAALVHRHGPMVWGVCRRILYRHQDAEDAFQATFLVLVRKAASVVPRDLIGNWLYGVAHQTALKARATAARRSAREKQVMAMPEPVMQHEHRPDDLQALLDLELSRLPDKYRAVIVLCDLEGKTRKEAAQHFHLAEGTVASRLATARAMLAKRLSRKGRAVSSVALTTVLAQNVTSAVVPASVTTATIKAASLYAVEGAVAGAVSINAVSLAEGVLRSMLLHKLKILTAGVLLLAVLATGAAALGFQMLADKPPDQSVVETKEPTRQTDKPLDQPVNEKKEQANQLARERKTYWPQWRGPTGMGTCDEKDLPLSWDARKGDNILWKVPLPGNERNGEAACPSHSCPIVWDERVFVTTAVYPPGGSFNNKTIGTHHILCYRASDGKRLWDTTVPDGRCRVNNPFHGYTTPTPVTDGQHVFAPFGSSVVACVNFDGKLIWREELPRGTREDVHSGEVSSPILYDDAVILMGVQTTGLRALYKKTGKLKWQQNTPFRNCMSTPVLIRVRGRIQLIHFAGGVQGLDPATGEEIWSCRVSTDWASPVYCSGLLYADAGVRPTFPVVSPADMGVVIDPTGKGDVTKTHVKWQTRVPEADGASAVISGDYIYRVSKPDVLRCWKLATGELVSTKRLPGIDTMASPIATADGRIYIACSAKSYVVKAGLGLEVLGSGELIDGHDYHTPTSAVSEGRLFIKGRTHLWCIGTR